MQKIPTRLRGTNFCTSSICFATSFVRQRNGHECTQIIQNVPKHHFRVQWGGLGVFVAKNSDTTWWHKLLHYIGPSCTEFRKATKRPECTQIERNTPKCQFTVQCGGSDAFIAENSDTISWHKLLHYFCPFCTEVRKPTKWSRMHTNSTKCTKTSV